MTDNNKERILVEIKTLEQIRYNGSKRHCWPREQISDVYEYGYIAGFDASTAIHQERTKKLIDKLKILRHRYDHDELETGYDILKCIDEALQEWGGE